MFNRIITALMEFAPPATETATPEMQFTPNAFVDNLQYMGMGMLGIFVVIVSHNGDIVRYLQAIFQKR